MKLRMKFLANFFFVRKTICESSQLKPSNEEMIEFFPRDIALKLLRNLNQNSLIGSFITYVERNKSTTGSFVC
jgi:hypothetical protein